LLFLLWTICIQWSYLLSFPNIWAWAFIDNYLLLSYFTRKLTREKTSPPKSHQWRVFNSLDAETVKCHRPPKIRWRHLNFFILRFLFVFLLSFCCSNFASTPRNQFKNFLQPEFICLLFFNYEFVSWIKWVESSRVELEHDSIQLVIHCSFK
jgi:hypothetical protein